MLGTRTRKIVRDITSRKTRTLLVSTSVFVGVLGVVTLTTLGALLSRHLEQDLHFDELAMLRLFLEAPAQPVADDTPYLDQLRAMPGVTQAEGQAVYQFKWHLPGDQDFVEGQLYAYTQPFGSIRLEPIRLMAGAYPTAGQQEIAVEQRMADKYDLKIGDALTVWINGETPHAENWRITGLVFQPYVYMGSGGSDTSVYAAFPDARRITGFTGLSSIYLRFDDFATARQQSRTVRRWVEQQTPYHIVFTLTDDPHRNIFIVGVHRFSRILAMLGVVALVVSSFLVTNVISTVISEQRRQIGAMKALGARRGDVFYMYLGLALGYGLLGTIPGVLLGIPLGQYAAEKTAPLANVILDDKTPAVLPILLGIGMGLGVPLLAALGPIWGGVRVTILEAITDQGIGIHYGKGPLARLVRSLPLSLTLHHALNNIARHLSRLSLTILSLTMASAAFMGVFATFHSLNNITSGMRETLAYHIAADPSQLQLGRVAQSLTYAENESREIRPGVAVKLDVVDAPVPSTVENTSQSDQSNKLFVAGADPAQGLDDLTFEAGSGWQDGSDPRGIVISHNVAQHYDKQVGDTLRLSSPQGSADFPIIGVLDFPLEIAFMDWQVLADFVGPVQDAPVPNAYWQQVRIDDRDSPLYHDSVWVVGIDERVGRALATNFDPHQPGVIISRTLADQGDYQPGDQLTLQSDAGSRHYPILQIVDVSPQQLEQVAQNVPEAVQQGGAAVAALYWEELESLQGVDYQELSPETFFINLESPSASAPTPPQVPAVAVHRNQLAVADTITQTILSVGLVMDFASLLLALVGAIGLLTIASIAVFERQREIGVMRSLGATTWTIIRQFLLEGLLVGLIAWALSVPLSYALSHVLIQAAPFREVVTPDYPLFVPLIGLGSMLLLTALSSLYPALIAGRMTVSSILHYQ